MRRSHTFVFLVLGLALLGGCPSKKQKYPICDSDKDCKEGEHCINKKCQQCGDDSHCPEGQKCDNGACVPEDFCRSDDDCTGGQVCKNNRCTACESDAECGPDARCSNGACLERGACNQDTDCADDEDCIDGMCQRPGRNPAPDVSCELGSVYFGFDQSSVDDGTKQALEKIAECILSSEGRAVIIFGHTDPRGTEEYNIALSESRGRSVADYLARLGVDPALMIVVPKGETEAAGTDESSWREDRRADFEWQ